jgi:hypothetical protein
MNRYDLLLAALATMFVAGCATAPTPAGGPDEKTYVTGSRLPSHDGVPAGDMKSVANQQDVHDMMQRSNINIPPKGGAN